jgi:hypothetical protein
VLYAIHVHSFIAVAVTTAVMITATLLPVRNDRLFVPHGLDLWRPLWLVPFALTATLTSVSLLLWLSGGAIRQGFLQYDPGWMATDFADWLWLWWSNGGVYYLVAAYATLTPRLWRSRFAAACAVSGWLVFAVINLVRLQPWDWDNTKLEIWAFVLLLPAVMLLLQSWWQAAATAPRLIGRLAHAATLIVALSLVPTGLLDLKQLLSFEKHTSVMWSSEDRELASTFRELASPGEVVLTVDQAHDWVSGLAGSQILLGFTGWLWSYGIETGPRQNEVRVMFQGGQAGRQLLQHYRVAWAVLDDEARRRYGANDDYFASRYRVALRRGDTVVYDLRASLN